MKKINKIINKFFNIINSIFLNKFEKKFIYVYKINYDSIDYNTYRKKFIERIIVIISITLILIFVILLIPSKNYDKYVQIYKIDLNEENKKAKLDLQATFENNGVVKNENYVLSYPQKLLTAEEKVDIALEYIDENLIKGNNTNLQEIKENLNFDFKLPYDVAFVWKSNTDNIDSLGNVIRPYKNEGDKKCKISVEVSNHEIKKVKEFNVIILEDELSKEEYEILNAKIELNNIIKNNDIYIYDLQNPNTVKLPNKQNNVNINWQIRNYQEDNSALKNKLIFTLIMIMCLVIYTIFKSVNSKYKNIKTCYEKKFPIFLEQFIILLGVGFTPYSIINYISENSLIIINFDNKNENLFFDGIKHISSEIKLGLPFNKSLEDFAKKTESDVIKRFAYNLIYNMKKGDSELSKFLIQELEQANEYNYTLKTIKANEINVKLIFPIVMNLISVIIIVTYPAITSLQI